MHKYSYHLTPVSNRCLAYTTLRAHLLRYQFQSLLEHAIRGLVPPSLGPDKTTVCCSVLGSCPDLFASAPPVRPGNADRAGDLLVIEHNRLFLVVFLEAQQTVVSGVQVVTLPLRHTHHPYRHCTGNRQDAIR